MSSTTWRIIFIIPSWECETTNLIIAFRSQQKNQQKITHIFLSVQNSHSKNPIKKPPQPTQQHKNKSTNRRVIRKRTAAALSLPPPRLLARTDLSSSAWFPYPVSRPRPRGAWRWCRPGSWRPPPIPASCRSLETAETVNEWMNEWMNEWTN